MWKLERKNVYRSVIKLLVIKFQRLTTKFRKYKFIARSSPRLKEMNIIRVKETKSSNNKK